MDMFRRTQLVVVCALLGSVTACGTQDPSQLGDEPSDENVGMATFELTSIPSGVGCVQIKVAGSTVVTKDFTLATGASTAALPMDRLPLGSIAIEGAAHAGACPPTTTPLYLADPATATLQAGVISSLALTFRKNNPVTASANFVGNVQAIAAQQRSTYAVIDGTIYQWGTNWATGVNNTVPTAFSSLTNMVELSQGQGSTTCALRNDGALWCWGDNNFGQVGVASPPTVATATRVGTETGYAMVATGQQHTCAAQPANRLIKCWGGNNSGQLGNGSTTSTSTPTNTSLLPTGVRALAVGNAHTCSVIEALGVRCWGLNSTGQLGDNSTVAKPVASNVVVAPIKSVGTGFSYSCAVHEDGSVRCWGNNGSGQLGNGTTMLSLVPVTVTGLAGVAKLAVGGQHACALLDSGLVRCWGANQSGQLGDGTVTTRTTPVAVSLPDPAVLISAGSDHTCAVTNRQDIYCWGENQLGALGNGSFVTSVRPVKVKLP
jgi:alpha-tubulin suppressor-like RCC1 family protein